MKQDALELIHLLAKIGTTGWIAIITALATAVNAIAVIVLVRITAAYAQYKATSRRSRIPSRSRNCPGQSI
jgi:hypothetical protein